MMMNVPLVICIIVASLVCSKVSSYNIFTFSFASIGNRHISRSVERISMAGAAIVDGARTGKLNKIKERMTGRYDLISMVEEGNEADSYSSFQDADSEQVDPPKVGQTVTGIIIEMDDNGALLEIGGKMSGYLPLKEASLVPVKELNGMYSIGQEITAEVIGTLKGMPVISLRPYQLEQAWEQILAIRTADTPFDAKVLEVNKGGAVCDVFGLKGFLPGSHCQGPADESLIGTVLKVSHIL